MASYRRGISSIASAGESARSIRNLTQPAVARAHGRPRPSVVERFLHVAELEVRARVEDLVSSHVLGDHPDNCRDRDPQITDTRDGVHLICANRERCEGHDQR
jgi:hypothetical protein